MTALFFITIIIAIALADHCRTKKEIKRHASEAQKNIARRRAAWDELNKAIYGQK